MHLYPLHCTHPSLFSLCMHINIKMASTRFLFATSMLLLSLIVIVSANDYGYAPKKPEYNEKPKPENKPLIPTKPDYWKPKLEGNDEPFPTKPDYEKPNPEGEDKQLPTTTGIQGTVLCKSGSKYLPLKGAKARITCLAIDEKGYETAPFSIVSDGCDANGYFFATLSGLKDNWKLKECKAFIYYSPLQTCKNPINVNRGISGDLLSSYRILKDKHMKLYSVGPFFYTTESQSTPSGY